MIPYGHQSIENDDIEAVVKVLKSDWLTQGPKIEEFEKALAHFCGAKYAVAVANGTTGLHLAYLAAGINQGNEVITTPNTFVATTNMLMVIGAKPVFVDVRLDTYNLDETKIEEKITKKTKAIIPVHFAGHPCEMEKILEIARKNKLIVVEDAAHALGAKYKNKKIGSLKSDLAVFSFHPVKSITTGEGGVIVTNNKKYYEKLKLLRSHGVYKNSLGDNIMSELGFNYRLTDIQAALGLSQLKKLDRFIKKRHQIVSWYKQELFKLNQIVLPAEKQNSYSAWHLMVIRVKNKNCRNPLKHFLLKNGISVNFHYPAVYKQPYYQKNGYKNIQLLNMEKYHQTALTLPLYPDLKKKQVIYICNKLKSFFQS